LPGFDFWKAISLQIGFGDSLESQAVILLVRADGAGGFAMRPRERRESGEQDLFRSRLDQIIDMNHALVKLARAIDWRFLKETFGAVYTDRPGQPPLPTRPPPTRVVEVFVAHYPDCARLSRPAQIDLKPSSSRTTT
jgi:hypothetical protein